MFKEGFFRVIRSILDLAFPRFCQICCRRLLSDERHICIYCLYDLPYTYFSKRTHNPMSDKFNYNIQRRIDAGDKFGPYKYSFACALFFYSSSSGYKEITKSLKYSNNLNSGRFFSIMLGCALASSVLFSDIDLVMPVPLHFSRKWHRGYNQAQIVAKEVAEILSARLITSVLVRSSRTKSQTKLRVSDKYDNVKNAFRVNKKSLMECVSGCDRGIHILLIDDVFTTGATLEACHYALSESLISLSVDNYRISVATLGFVC